MKLALSRIATRRIQGIATYIRRHDPSAAERVRDAILTSCTLTEHPFAGRQYRLGMRVFFLPRFPYVIYYEVDEEADVLTVLTVRHTSQQSLQAR